MRYMDSATTNFVEGFTVGDRAKKNQEAQLELPALRGGILGGCGRKKRTRCATKIMDSTPESQRVFELKLARAILRFGR